MTKLHQISVEKIDEILFSKNMARNGPYSGKVALPTPLKCKTCGHAWSTRIMSIKEGRGCPACSKASGTEKRKTPLKEIDTLLESRNIRRNGDYVGSTHKPTPLKCNICENEWSTSITTIKSKHSGCPQCSKKRVAESQKISIEDIDARLGSKGLSRHGPYSGMVMNPTPLKCNVCDYAWTTTLNSVFNGDTGCPSCSGALQFSTEKVDEILQTRNIVRNGAYVGNTSKKTPLKCVTCLYEWAAAVTGIYHKNYGCPSCSGRTRWTLDEVDSLLLSRHIRRDGDYIGNSYMPMPLKCLTCDHSWSTTVNSISNQNSKCPVCSRVEAGKKSRTPISEVDEILESKNIARNGPYIGTVMKATPLKCGVCANEWAAAVHNIKQGGGCPHCAKDRNQPNGIYHLFHSDHPYQYIGISYKPKYRLNQHQEDKGPRGELARELKIPYEFTVAEIHNVMETATSVQDDVAAWHASNPFGRVAYGAVVHDTPFEELSDRVKSKPARVPRFVAEWIETELIRHLSVNFPADNPFSAAGKVKLVNIAKNFPSDAISA